MITQLHQQEHYPITALCRLLGLPRSSYYHQPQPRDEAVLRTALASVAAAFPTYGSRRLCAQLRRPPHEQTVNRKRMQRLMCATGLQPLVKRRTPQTTRSQHHYRRYPNLMQALTVSVPEQVWVADITYVRLHHEWVYLAVLMDVFTRSIRGWHLHRWLDHTLTLTALQRALVQGVPQIHHSDQGVQYATKAYTGLLRQHQIQVSMAEVGAAWQNGYAERLIRTIKEEEIDLSEYASFADAYQQIGHFIQQVYQHKRIHSALGYLTPAEFEAAWSQQHLTTPSLRNG